MPNRDGVVGARTVLGRWSYRCGGSDGLHGMDGERQSWDG